MPARRNKAGTFSDIVHPIHQPFRDYLEEVVIGAYWRELGIPPDDDAEA
jgi:DNA-binding cell septation regulator SpoVG